MLVSVVDFFPSFPNMESGYVCVCSSMYKGLFGFSTSRWRVYQLRKIILSRVCRKVCWKRG